jgi:hypothetical protein
MPAQSRRHAVADPDDPWGFGAPDGTLVEVRYDPRTAGLGRQAPARHEPPPPPPIRERRDAIDLMPGGGKPPRELSPEPAGEARLRYDVDDEAHQQYFRPQRRRPRGLAGVVVVSLLAMAATGAYVWRPWEPPAPTATPLPVGTFVLSSQPAGAEVLVDGVSSGRTPLALDLPPGDHTVVVTDGGVSQRLIARVAAGETASQHVVLEPPAPLPETLPSPAPVSAAPRDPAPAARAAVPAPAPAQGRGFVVLDLPFAVQVFEHGRRVGTSRPGERLPLAAGTHTLTLVSEELGFRGQQTVVVSPGRASRVVVGQVTAPLSVNAVPWAEVFISGRSFGETPLADVTLPIGTYQVTLRHPTHGERVVAVSVRLGAPNHLTVDMRP